jgi:hypothetical protein
MTVSDLPSPLITSQAGAIKKAMMELKKLHAARQVANTVNTRNSPKTTNLYELLSNSLVLVWCEGNGGKPGYWDSPLTMMTIKGKTCIVLYPCGPLQFKSTLVKPYYSDGNTLIQHVNQAETLVPEAQIKVPAKKACGRLWKTAIEAQKEAQKEYQDNPDTSELYQAPIEDTIEVWTKAPKPKGALAEPLTAKRPWGQPWKHLTITTTINILVQGPQYQ